MSKYLLNKFLYTIDRDPELVERYRDDPRGTVTWWETERANLHPQLPHRRVEHVARLRRAEREALATHDYPTLFGLGAHPFLTLTLFIAMFERDHEEPLGFQLQYATALQHVLAAVRRHQHLTMTDMRHRQLPRRHGMRRS